MTATRIAGGVYLIDISAQTRQLMEHRPVTRPLETVDKVFVHHSGATGRHGQAGAIASTRFVLRIRDWRMPAYHYWIPRKPDDCSRVEIYQIAPPSWRCYHTGGAANDRGIGVVAQGNTTLQPMTHHQEEALEAILPYCQEQILNIEDEDTTWLSWHSASAKWGGSGKPACPGRRLERWLQDYQSCQGLFCDAEWQ